MTTFAQMLASFFRLFRWFITVSPWERGLRVRLGKHVRLIEPGWHFIIPYVDKVYVQSVRRRVTDLSKQTLTTRDGKTITVAGSLGYEITDIRKLYESLHHPEDTLANMTQAAIADFICRHDVGDLGVDDVTHAITDEMDFEQYGISNTNVVFNDFAVVRTYRIIGDYGGNRWGDSLNTQQTVNQGPNP